MGGWISFIIRLLGVHFSGGPPVEINQNFRTLLWNINSLEQWSMSGLHSVVE